MLGYKRETFERETWISATKPATIDEQGLRFKVTIEPHGRWETELHVATGVDAPGQSVATPSTGAAAAGPSRTWSAASTSGSTRRPA